MANYSGSLNLAGTLKDSLDDTLTFSGTLSAALTSTLDGGGDGDGTETVSGDLSFKYTDVLGISVSDTIPLNFSAPISFSPPSVAFPTGDFQGSLQVPITLPGANFNVTLSGAVNSDQTQVSENSRITVSGTYQGIAINGTITGSATLMASATQTSETTVPALIVYDAFYGATENSGGLNYVINADVDPLIAAFTQSNNPNLQEAIYATLGSWFSNGSNNFAALYGNVDSTTYIDDVYQNIFGTAPNASALSYLLGSLNNYVNSASAAGLPDATLLGRGAVYGDLLFEAETAQTGKYFSAANDFLQAVLNGTATYGPELTSEFSGGGTSGSEAGAVGSTNTVQLSDVTSANTAIAQPSSDIPVALPSTSNGITTVSSPGWVIEPATGNHVIQFLTGASADTLVLSGGGVDQVSGFDPSADTLDFSTLLNSGNINLNGDIATLANYVTVVDQGANAVVNFDPSGHGGGSAVAVLQGLGDSVTGLASLIAQNAVRIT